MDLTKPWVIEVSTEASMIGIFLEITEDNTIRWTTSARDATKFSSKSEADEYIKKHESKLKRDDLISSNITGRYYW